MYEWVWSREISSVLMESTLLQNYDSTVTRAQKIVVVYGPMGLLVLPSKLSFIAKRVAC